MFARLGTVLLAMFPALAWSADAQIASFVDSPDPVPATGKYTYSVQVNNNALDAALNTHLILNVPAGATFVSASSTSGTCSATSATTVDCSLGSIPANGTGPVDVTFTWQALGPAPALISATATVTSDNDTNSSNNTQTQGTTVVAGANLSLTKSGSPNPVVGGANITYTLTALNAGPDTAGDIVITDNLPPSVTYVSSSGTGWSCNNSGILVTCTHSGTHAANVAIPSLSIVGTANAVGGTITNSASVATASGGIADPDTTNNTVTADVLVLPGADVKIAQKLVTSGSPAVAGSNVTFQIQARNSGPVAATNVVVSDNLPTGWTFVSATGPNWSCSAAGQAVTCSRSSMPAGATDDINVVATAPGVLVIGSGASYSNTATISSASTDPVSSNNSGSVTISVMPTGADLSLTKNKAPSPATIGTDAVSRLTVVNNGPLLATGTLRVLDLLSGESYTGFSGTGWTCSASGSLVTCDHSNAGGLAVGSSLPELKVFGKVTATGSITNTACTGASVPAGAVGAVANPPAEGDGNSANDCASATVSSTSVVPDLSISKTTITPTGGDKIVSGTESSVTFRLTIANVSSTAQPATGVRIQDTIPGFIVGKSTFNLPVTVNVSSGSTATFTCSPNDAEIFCRQTGGVFASGETATLDITVNRPLSDGTFTNTAYVYNAAEGDPNNANNNASDTVTIDPVADVEMTGKAVTPASVRAGENATYVLSFKNNGYSSAQGVVVTDTFTIPSGDSGLTVVSIVSSKPGSTCTIAAGSVLTDAAASYSCNIGTMIDGETQSISLVVRPNFQSGNASRTISNTAQISTSVSENGAGGNNGNNTKLASLSIEPSSVNILVNKIDLADPVGYFAGGSFLDYRVRVTSTGPSYATNVKISESMLPPAGKRVRFVCDTTALGGSTCNSPSLCSVANVTSAAGTALPSFTCNLPAGDATTGLGNGELAANQSKDIFLRFEAVDSPGAAGDSYSNTAGVSSNEPDSLPSDNSITETTTVRQRVDLRVTKSASNTSPTLMQPFNWVISVVNNGPGHSQQTDLTDTLPTGTEVLGAVNWTRSLQAGSGTCSVAGLTVSCSLGQLDATGTATVTIPVRLTVAGSVSNSATVDTDPAKTGAVDFPGGNNTGSSTVSVTSSSISGTVFEDRDRSGSNGGVPQAASAEPRIGSVSLSLTGTDAYGNAVSRSTTSESNGNYSFGNLPPSSGAGYTITETQASGYYNSPSSPPASGGSAPSAGGTYTSGGTSGASSYTGLVLAAGTAATQYNFPEVRLATLSGVVYVDTNLNNSWDSSTEAGISGATVRLLNASTLALIATTTTNSSGAYSFTGLDPFVLYTLEQPLPSSPPGLLNGVANPGLIGGAACASGCTAVSNSPVANTDRITNIDLSSGADGTLFNFGERPTTAVAGTVFLDTNKNGSLDSGETTRLSGVTVRLVQGSDCSSGTTVQSTTSDSNGNYAFSSVPSGQDYLICETQPGQYGSTSADQITITNLSASGSVNNNFGERLSSIAGSVWLDSNNDGVQQGGESGISGVTISLSGTDVNGASMSRSTSTDSSGNWSFDNLLPGTYTVTEQSSQPVVSSVTTLNGRTLAGSLGGTATAVGVAPSAISNISLGVAADATGNLFAEILPVSISGTVFSDQNNNGVLNAPGDVGLSGISIVVTGTDDTGAAISRNLTTASDGSYSVTDLRPGTYTITEPTQPAGTINGLTVAGSQGGTVTLPAATPSAISSISLTTPGVSSTGNNFAEVPNSGVISGRVWLDADNNSVLDGTEAGISGVSVELTGTDLVGNAVTRTTTSDVDGNFSFTSLAPGSYTLLEPNQPAGTVNGATLAGSAGGTATAKSVSPSSISGIALSAGQTASANNFGEVPSASLSGKVWADNNNNAVIDSSEAGLLGVTINLTGTDDLGAAVSLSTTTAADGSYSFTGLRPGTYALTEPVQPTGTLSGQTVAGSLGGSATAVTVTPSVISAIVLAPGASGSQYNFGELSQSPDLRVSKSHSPSTFTVGHVGTYTITVRNIGELVTSGAYTVSDRLPVGLTLASTPVGTGWTCTGAVGASSLSCTSSTVLAAGATSSNVITVQVNVAAAAAAASPVSNAVLVEGGGEIDARAPTTAERDAFNGTSGSLPLCSASVDQNACRDATPVQLAATLSGTVWFDSGSQSRLLDSGDRRLSGWKVEVVDPTTNAVVGSGVTGADGTYSVVNLVPGTSLGVRFRDPASNVVFGYPVNGESAPGSSGAGCVSGSIPTGQASSCVNTGAVPQLTVTLVPGQNLAQQSLPVDPSGVVYDSGLRTPVAGSLVTLAPVGACTGWNPTTSLVAGALGGYSISGDSASMTVGADGVYQFLFSPAAPATCTFSLSVTPPSGYTFVSKYLSPVDGVLTPSGGAGSTFAVQTQGSAPTGSAATTYYLQVRSGSAGANIVHNHIPVDPALPAAVNLFKTGDRAQVEVGDSVRYTITVKVATGALPRQTTVVDRLPAGFTYIAGTATVNDKPLADPQGGAGPNLAFHLGSMPASGQFVLRYRVRVGVGSQQGDGINRAQGYACGVPAGCVGANFAPLAGAVATNESQFKVRVSGGVFATEACFAGKIFVDCNHNHVQDEEELGIPGVRLYMEDGSTLISDSEGKYSQCGITPRSHVLKVDPVTLPIGSRLTTSSNRNLGDAGSLWLDLKNGELGRADFIEGSCSNRVLEQVKARRAQGEVRAPEREKGPSLRIESKPVKAPRQATDSANQPLVQPREVKGGEHAAQ